MPFAKLSPDYTLYYLDENPTGKQTIFLFHGLGANSNSWQMQIPDLIRAGYRVIAPDAPGFGNSRKHNGKTQIAFTANLFSGLMEFLGLSHVALAGLSMGGAHALQFALDYPARVDKLVLINTFPKLKLSNPIVFPYFATRMLLVHTLGLKTQARTVAKRVFPKPDQDFLRQELVNQIQDADPSSYRSAMRSLARFDVINRLEDIRCPTLVISGERDTTVPLETQTIMANRIPGAVHKIISDAGHGVTIEKYLEFNQILIDFLNGNLTTPKSETSENNHAYIE